MGNRGFSPSSAPPHSASAWSQSYFSPETTSGQTPARPSIYYSSAGLSLAPEQLQVWFLPVQTNHCLGSTAVRLIHSTKLNPSLWRCAIHFCMHAHFSLMSDSARIGAHRCSVMDAAATAGQIQTPLPVAGGLGPPPPCTAWCYFRKLDPKLNFFRLCSSLQISK